MGAFSCRKSEKKQKKKKREKKLTAHSLRQFNSTVCLCSAGVFSSLSSNGYLSLLVKTKKKKKTRMDDSFVIRGGREWPMGTSHCFDGIRSDVNAEESGG